MKEEKIKNSIEVYKNMAKSATQDSINYKSRIDKAIEYIKQHCEIVRFEDKGIDMIGKVEGIPLLNILGGKNE